MEKIFQDDAYARGCKAKVKFVDDRGIQLDRTVFYPTGGGQPGDTGILTTMDGIAINIVNSVKGDGQDGVLHVLADDSPTILPGTQVTAEIDWDRRHRLMRMHTCMHLLSVIVPFPVTGGQVGDEKAGLTSTFPRPASTKKRSLPRSTD